MSLKLEFRRYRRHLKRPMVNAHGYLAERSGIILRLIDAKGREGYGEVAPLKWFGTESFQDAWAFLESLGNEVTETIWAEIPLSLPCSRFAIDSALHMIAHLPAQFQPPRPALEVAALLPGGEQGWISAGCRIQEGYRCLKMKIGVEPQKDEISLLDRIVEVLKPGMRIRLDANGGLDPELAENWVRYLAPIKEVEFIEQPLPPRNMAGHRKLADIAEKLGHPQLIGLDESLNDPSDAADIVGSGWPGFHICKPLVQGPRDGIEKYQKRFGQSVVFSSAFETAIGVEAILTLASDGGNSQVLGLGTLNFFEEDGLGHHPLGPEIRPDTMILEHYQDIWKRLLD